MYLRLFATVDDRRWRGESTTLYLYDSKAATAIRRRCPDARIVAIVREPVDRAFSAWSFARRRGWEREADFRRALDAEAERVRAGWGALWHYRRQGMYAGQIARYLDVFGPDRVFVRSFDLLRADPHRFFRELLVFLGLDWPPGFTVTLERNVGSLPRVSLLSRLLYLRTRVPPETRLRLRASALGRAVGAGLTLIERVNGSRTTRLTPAIAHDLQAAFADDIRATARLTGQPLAEWLGRYAGESETRSESSPAAGR
jgi:hypothetical protein